MSVVGQPVSANPAVKPHIRSVNRQNETEYAFCPMHCFTLLACRTSDFQCNSCDIAWLLF